MGRARPRPPLPFSSGEFATANRGREELPLPALRTVRAVFPHTALQSVVSSSGVSRGAPGPIQAAQPGLREESVGPEAMGGLVSSESGSVLLLLEQLLTQSSAGE